MPRDLPMRVADLHAYNRLAIDATVGVTDLIVHIAGRDPDIAIARGHPDGRHCASPAWSIAASAASPE